MLWMIFLRLVSATCFSMKCLDIDGQKQSAFCHTEEVDPTHIPPPLLCSHASFLSVVGIRFGFVLEGFLEGVCYVVVAEASEPERPGDFAVLLGHWLSGCEEGAKRIEADEEVLFGHDVMDQIGG